LEDSWLTFAKRLQAIANTGLGFTKDPYDNERYEEVSAIATAMLSALGGVPITKMENLVTAHTKGYDTPKIDVRGAVFNAGKILLVQEKTDGCWALPGGYADVGLSASENVEKEIEEEAGIRVKARQLYSVRHKAKGDFDPDVRDFYKLYFICDRIDERTLKPGAETIDARFFSLSNLPQLSTGRVIKEDLHAAWKFTQNASNITAFD